MRKEKEEMGKKRESKSEGNKEERNKQMGMKEGRPVNGKKENEKTFLHLGVQRDRQ